MLLSRYFFMGLGLSAALLQPQLAYTGEQANAATLKFERPWARATVPGVSQSVAYLTIVNASPLTDQLIGAEADIAQAVVFHQSLSENGVAKMREVAKVNIPGSDTVQFVPRGLHLMLMGLKKPLLAGDRFTLTLRFELAGAQTVPVKVEEAGHQGTAGRLRSMSH